MKTISLLASLCIAVGACRESSPAVLYQQLHSYPVGNSGKELARRTHGAKHWIAPVRRELLIDFDCVLGVRADDAQLLERVALGLAGQLGARRYGLPFAGDNNLLFSRIDILPAPVPADRSGQELHQPPNADASPEYPGFEPAGSHRALS